VISLVLIMGCENAIDVMDELNFISTESLPDVLLDPVTLEILEAAYRYTPIDTSDWYIYGVLDRDRTDIFCYIAYSNAYIYEEYELHKINESWELGKKIRSTESGKFSENSILSAQSGTAYTRKIANIYSGQSHNILRDEWYVPGNHQQDGVFTKTKDYHPALPTRAQFIEGTQIVGINEHKIEWVGPCVWRRFSFPSGQLSSNFRDVHTQFFHNGQLYPSERLSATYRHRITQIGIPSTPTLQSPADGFKSIFTPINFSWNASSGSGTVTYRLQIANTSNFATLFFDESGISNTNKSVGNFSPGEKYYWRVRAQNEAGTGDWSTVWSFTAPLGIPQVSGSIENGHPKLTWSAVSQADYYEIFKRSDASGWLSYASTGSTSYVDIMADVTGYQGTVPLSTPYIAYYVVARANNGAKSPNSSEHYYDYSGFTPLGGDHK